MLGDFTLSELSLSLTELSQALAELDAGCLSELSTGSLESY